MEFGTHFSNTGKVYSVNFMEERTMKIKLIWNSFCDRDCQSEAEPCKVEIERNFIAKTVDEDAIGQCAASSAAVPEDGEPGQSEDAVVGAGREGLHREEHVSQGHYDTGGEGH